MELFILLGIYKDKFGVYWHGEQAKVETMMALESGISVQG